MKWPVAFRELTMGKVSGTEFGENEARRSISPKPTYGQTTQPAGTARGLCGISHMSTVGQCYLLLHSAPSRIFISYRISYRENSLERDGASIAGTRSHA
jgi:hypothetical protein